MLYYVARIMSPDFLKKCQMHPISEDQWQIAKFILEFKPTHSTGIIFDGILVEFFTIKRFVPQCDKIQISTL